MKRLWRQQDDRGATAVLVGLLATFLLGISAFTVDFGIAFANTRQLQTAADAAALGASGVFASSQKFTCADVRTDKLSAAGVEVANKIVANKPAGVTATLAPGGFTATCTSKGLEVTATVLGTSSQFFGGLLGQSGDYNLRRTATAVVEAATGVGSKLRPMAVCSSDLPATVTAGTVFLLRLPGDGLAPSGSCPLPPNAGNWWTLDCPEESSDDGGVANGGTSGLEEQIRNGCKLPVSIVSGQEGATGAALRTILTSACSAGKSLSAPYQCLSGDPGQPDAGKIETAWRDLIDARTESLIPSFCAGSPALPSPCDQTTVSGTGTNAVFPVHKFIAATVCAYHFGKQPSKQYDGLPIVGINDPCAPAAPQMASIDAQKNDDDRYLVLVFKNAQASGSTAPGCPLGISPCDTGVRQVRLTR